MEHRGLLVHVLVNIGREVYAIEKNGLDVAALYHLNEWVLGIPICGE